MKFKNRGLAIVRLTLTVVLCLSTYCLALAGPNHWTQEPTAVLGIQLGKPLGTSNLATCEKPRYGDRSWTPPTALCVNVQESIEPNSVLILDGLPWPDIAVGGYLHLFDGKAEAVSLDFPHGDYQRFKAILIAKYGAPHSTTAEEVTSIGGAKVSAENCTWTGKSMTIELLERAGRIDRSDAIFSDIVLEQQKRDAQKQKIDADASKL